MSPVIVRPHWMVIINFPDERMGKRRQFDHMHAWFPTEGEAREMGRLIDDRLGGSGSEVMAAAIGVTCPRCGRLAVTDRR